MESTFWIATGAIVGTATLAVTLLVHLVRYAYRQGGIDTRIRALEVQVASGVDTREAIAGLTATIEGLKRSFDKLDDFLDRRVGAIEARLDGAPTPGRRRAAVG